MPGPSLGTNLFPIVDWSTAFPFIDLFKMSRPWYTQSDEQFDTRQADMLKLDDKGWVQAFTQDGDPAPFDSVSTILFTKGHVPGGVYVLDWKGEGNVDLGLIDHNQIISRDDGKIVFRLKEGQTLQVSINSTDPNHNGDYIRNIRLYNQQDKDLLNAGKTFAPEFLEKIEDFRALRFMQWMETINSDVSEWNDRRPANYARESSYESGPSGASIETMVALANETNSDPWFSLPHMASDDYIRQFVTYVKNNLDAGLVARFEFSNEVWNWGFEQTQYAQARAKELWGEDVEGGWMQWYGMRAARMADIVEEVYGKETGERALSVFATQAGWLGLENYALDAPDLVASGGTPPKDAPFHVYAIAPYFGGEIGNDEYNDLLSGWMNAGEQGFKQAIDFIRNGPASDSLANIGEIIAYHAKVAKSLGLQLEAYEGGQHVVDGAGLFGAPTDQAETDFFVKLVKRPEFLQLYEEYLNIWKENGGGLMAQFTDFSVADKYGSWGIWDSAYSADSPRARAIKEFRDGVDVWWDDDRPASVFDNGITRVDRDGLDKMTGTSGDDALVGLGGNDWISGRAGDDYLIGGDGDDTLLGQRGNDRLDGGSGEDVMRGGDGHDGMFGRADDDVIAGGNGSDRLHGGNGSDKLNGGNGDDTLRGGDGDDSLDGGSGVDWMSGGAGADVFAFDFVGHSPTGKEDHIADFQRGIDKIDLGGLVPGKIAWLGAASFTASGRAEAVLVVPTDRSDLMLRVDTDGDGKADLSLVLTGLKDLGATDLVL